MFPLRLKPVSFLAITLGMLFLFPMIVYAWTGFYARYAADDYQTAYILRDLGFFNAQVYWYNNWTGRVSFNFTLSLFELIGTKIVPFLPSLVLILFVVVWAWIFFESMKLISPSPEKLVALALALILAFLFFSSLPNLRQVLFWQTGLVNYLTPTILFALIIGLVLRHVNIFLKRQKSTPWNLAICLTILSCIAGAYTETYTVFQLVFFVISFFICALILRGEIRRRVCLLLFFTIVGSLFSMFIVVIAPGNALRQAPYRSPPNLLSLLRITKNYSFRYLRGHSNKLLPHLLIGIIFTASLIKSMQTIDLKPRWVYFGTIGFTGFVALLVFLTAISPVVWGTRIFPPQRTWTISLYGLHITVIILGIIIGLMIKRYIRLKPVYIAMFIIMIFWLAWIRPIKAAVGGLRNIPIAQIFASQWDKRDQLLRAAAKSGVNEIEVFETINYYNLDQLEAGEPNWINRSMENYYQIEKIRLKVPDMN